MAAITYKLSEPTCFPELNKKEEKETGFERDEITLQGLKYKHFREVMKYPEQDQMHHLMILLTGLSEEDLGELTPDDAAEISKIIFQSISKYMELGKHIIKTMETK